MGTLKGEITAVKGRLMTGWIASPDGVESSVLIEFTAGDQVLGGTLARIDPDAESPRLIFEFLLPAGLTDDEIKTVSARAGGAPVDLGDTDHKVAGFVDLIADDLTVKGWAWYPGQPKARAELEFVVNDEVAGSAIADLNRLDVAAAGIGDGHYGFSWQIPFPALVSPREIIVSVRDKADGTMLPNPLAIQPQDMVERLERFAAQAMQTQPDEATAALQAALRLAPEDPWRRLKLGEMLLGWRRLDEAESVLQEIFCLKPQFWHAHVTLGHCARARGDHTAALGCFMAAAEMAPGDVWRWLDVAEELRQLGRLDDAEAALEQALGLAPELWSVHLALGHCARARGNRTAALGYFETAVRLSPENIGPRLHIAEEQRDTGDLDGARRTARVLLQDHPAHVQVLLSLAYTECRAGQHDEAAAWLRKAHEIEPQNPVILVELARVEYTLGWHEISNRHLIRALEIDPAHTDAVVRMAQQALAVGDAAQAHGIYREAANQRPAVFEFRFGMLDALSWMGRSAEAIAGLAAIEARNGAVPGLRAWQITLLRRAGLYHDALQVARVATETEPNQFWLWVERFYTELLVGDDASAQKCLFSIPAVTRHEKAIKRRCVGALAESLWLIENAIEHYEAAATLNPDDAGLQEALVRSRLLLVDLPAARRHLQYQYGLIASDRRLRGESPNISQSLLGQVLDEYSLDQQVMDKLAELRSAPPGARVRKLCDLAGSNRESTAAAVSLLVAMRQAGALRYTPENDAHAEIPKVIIKFWDTQEIPEDVLTLIEGWQETNPGYRLQRFSDSSAREYLKARFPPEVLAAYKRVRALEQKADIFRLAVLVFEGGIYSDVDDRCLKPLETIIPAGANLVLGQEIHGFAANNFIASVPNHPVLASALQAVTTAVNRGDNEIPWLLSGPGVLTRALAQYLVACDAAVKLPAGLALLDLRELNQAVAANSFATYKVYKMKNKKRIDAAFASQAEASGKVDA